MLGKELRKAAQVQLCEGLRQSLRIVWAYFPQTQGALSSQAGAVTLLVWPVHTDGSIYGAVGDSAGLGLLSSVPGLTTGAVEF